MTRLALALSLAFAFVCALAAHARADAKTEAKQHVARGTASFKAGSYDDAIKELKQAYVLDPQPQLLYAIGQAYIKLGDCATAVTFYERFLATQPSQDEANIVNQAIARCKDVLVEPQKPQPATEPAKPIEPPAKPVEAPPKPVVAEAAQKPVLVAAPWYTDALGDALVATGVVAGGFAGLAYGRAVSDRNNADTAATYQSYRNLVSSARTAQSIAIGSGIAGGVLVVTGVVRYATHHRYRERVAIVPIAGGAFVAFGGGF